MIRARMACHKTTASRLGRMVIEGSVLQQGEHKIVIAYCNITVIDVLKQCLTAGSAV